MKAIYRSESNILSPLSIIQPRILVSKSLDRDFSPISAFLSDVGVICPNILRYSFEVMQLGGWAIYLTSVLSSTTPDSIIYSKDYRLWGGIKVISAILSGFQPILTRF